MSAPRSRGSNRPDGALADTVLSKALTTVVRHGWPDRRRDEALARDAFERWKCQQPDADVAHEHADVLALIDAVDAALLAVYEEPMRVAVTCLLVFELYAAARMQRGNRDSSLN